MLGVPKSKSPEQATARFEKKYEQVWFLPFETQVLWGPPFVSPKKFTEMHFQIRDLYKKTRWYFVNFQPWILFE